MLDKYTIKDDCKPRHDKTNKMAVRPAKTQTSLGIRTMHHEDAQADLSLR